VEIASFVRFVLIVLFAGSLLFPFVLALLLGGRRLRSRLGSRSGLRRWLRSWGSLGLRSRTLFSPLPSLHRRRLWPFDLSRSRLLRRLLPDGRHILAFDDSGRLRSFCLRRRGLLLGLLLGWLRELLSPLASFDDSGRLRPFCWR